MTHDLETALDAVGATKPAPRISVGLTLAELEEFLALARTCQTSPSRLGQIAVRQMLVQARAGALPMVAPSLVKAATPHPELGYDPRTGFTFPIVQS